MGRIKTTLVKRNAEKVLEAYRENLSGDFEKNKGIVKRVISTDKKKRNQIAGYIAKKIRKHSKAGKANQ
ncbi:30S ribosomal protein S17e [Candidatus Pacearchaeota archaeon CG_4_9_14_3_um_filter_31_7]|nr:MAG: hypothetical protein AUJ10_00545 [Candidatus Pacearchaeota archaeon CG1_02_31_27]PIN92308.1 MAG: 30S ribosomal protein S17e [Candidatus Pacearchaeota archaeon CG10_big_fil_rev_8_21_14_0_10_31_59]PIZ79975.1 MAG: 30S ribosomal protein S17e [Candidatus Pacearchaeota archaeon CG_4_10_14_0_2_um_filter_31_10]PJA70965.1 MAG: 30S ribosomal protein S17e [Candidatus Pacearchaeota archaeon CG_4_9_14_3_um_filter_31_7]